MKTRRDFLRIAGWSGLGLFGFPGATVAGSRPPFPIPERAGYGPLGLADENGLQLPKGFSSRVVASPPSHPFPRSRLIGIARLMAAPPLPTLTAGGSTFQIASKGTSKEARALYALIQPAS